MLAEVVPEVIQNYDNKQYEPSQQNIEMMLLCEGNGLLTLRREFDVAFPQVIQGYIPKERVHGNIDGEAERA